MVIRGNIFINTVVSFILVSLVVCLNSLAIASDEYDIDQSKSTEGSSVSMTDILDGYLSEKGWIEGENVKDGKTFYVSAGYSSVTSPRTSPMFIQSRQNAFDKAMLSAKKELAEYMEVSIKTELESHYSEPGQARQKKELEKKYKEGLALELARDGGAAINNDVAKELGYSSAEIIADKSNALLRAEINQRLKDLGYNPNEPVDKQVLEKVIATGSFKKMVASQSKLRITGLQAFKTFENIKTGNNGEIGVVAIYSDRLGAVANAIFSGNMSNLPKVKPKKPLIQQIPDADALISTFGVKQVINEHGNYALLSYAQSAPTTDTDRSMQAAMDKAKLQAEGLIRQYAGEIYAVASLLEEVENSQQLESGEANIEYDSDYQQTINAKAESLKISGMSTLKRWSAPHPVTGKKIAGVVVMWSVDSVQAAKKLSNQMSEVPKKNPGNSSGSAVTGPISSSYKEESNDGDEDAF